MTIRNFCINAAGIIFTNRIHVAVMPIVLTVFWNQVSKLPLPLEYYLMVMLTTAGGYIYNMQTDAKEDALNYAQKYRLFLPNSALTKRTVFVMFALAFLISLRAGWQFVLYGGVVNFLFSLYSRPLPLKWHGRTVRVKEIPFFKNIYCACCWSIALILTPYVYLNAPIDDLAVVGIMLCFAMDYFAEVLWDIRDMEGDAKAGFRTVPLVIGVEPTYWLLRLVHVFTCGVILWCFSKNLMPYGGVIVAIHLPVGLLFLQWYKRLPEKEWASHLYVIYAGLLIILSMAWNFIFTNGT